jgi:hypothetical protein
MKRLAKTLAERAGASEGSSQGGYVSRVLVQRDDTWTSALDYLLAHEWKKAEIRKALDEMPGLRGFVARPREGVERATGCHVSIGEALAMRALALEWNAGNAEVARRL